MVTSCCFNCVKLWTMSMLSNIYRASCSCNCGLWVCDLFLCSHSEGLVSSSKFNANLEWIWLNQGSPLLLSPFLTFMDRICRQQVKSSRFGELSFTSLLFANDVVQRETPIRWDEPSCLQYSPSIWCPCISPPKIPWRCAESFFFSAPYLYWF